MANLPDISEMRGMGDPLYFSFNIEPKTNILICHAVIFATFTLSPQEKIKLCEPSDDPRMPHFQKFIWENYLKDMKKKFLDEVSRTEVDIKLLEEQVEQIKKRGVK